MRLLDDVMALYKSMLLGAFIDVYDDAAKSSLQESNTTYK